MIYLSILSQSFCHRLFLVTFPVVPAEEPGPRNDCCDIWQSGSLVEAPDLRCASSGATGIEYQQ